MRARASTSVPGQPPEIGRPCCFTLAHRALAQAAPTAGGPWRRWIDTSLEPPEDIVSWKEAPSFAGHTYRAGPHSVVLLYQPLPSSADGP